MVTTIPLQLQNETFRFIKVKKGQKIPVEAGWNKNANYKFNDYEFNVWLKDGNNYGVACGYGDIYVLDFDNKEFEEKTRSLLPETFTVKTGGGGVHKYFIVKNQPNPNIVLYENVEQEKENIHLGEFQGLGKQVVGVGSLHPNGHYYTILNDVPIAELTVEKIREIFKDYINVGKGKNKKGLMKETLDPFKHCDYNEHYNKGLLGKEGIDYRINDPIRDLILKEIPLKKVLMYYGYDFTKNPTMCLLGHDSKGGACFSYNLDENWFNCFHCNEAGDVINLVMAHEKCNYTKAKKILCEKIGDIDENKTKYKNMRTYLCMDRINWVYEQQPFFYDKSGYTWLWNTDEKRWVITDETDLLNVMENYVYAGLVLAQGNKTLYLEGCRKFGRLHIPEDAPKEWIQFKDKVFDIKTGKIFDATPEYFFCNPIPYAISDSAETPILDKLFKEWVGEKYAPSLYELIAYCCYIDYPIHLVFVLFGNGRNGKSVFQRLLSKFLGKENICSTDLENLSENRFESFKLHKKLACFMGETNFGLLAHTQKIKMLCAQDQVSFEAKNKQPFNATNYAKIVINSNNLPPSLDTTDGFYRKWLIIPFTNEFPEGKDILEIVPEKEYNALARKITKILPVLIERGNFTNQGSIDQRKEAYISASNPLSKFIETYCVSDSDDAVLTANLYKGYCAYLDKIKRRKIMRKEFLKLLSEEGFGQRLTKHKDGSKDDYGNDVFISGLYIEGLKIKAGIKDYEVGVPVVKTLENLETESAIPRIPRIPRDSYTSVLCEGGGNNKVKTGKTLENLENLENKEQIVQNDLENPLSTIMVKFLEDVPAFESDNLDLDTIRKVTYGAFLKDNTYTLPKSIAIKLFTEGKVENI